MEFKDTFSSHLKGIENKSSINKIQIRNIDYIYLINLDRRPERLHRSLQQLAPYGIMPHRVSGIDGWALGQDVFDDVAMIVEPSMQYDQPVQVGFRPGNYPSTPFENVLPGQRCLHSQTAAGVIGCSLTHLSILEDAYSSGYGRAWVLEDDFTVNGNPHDLARLIDELNGSVGEDGWDILYTDDDDCYTAETAIIHCGSRHWIRPGTPMTPRLVERTAVSENFFKIGGRTQAHSYVVQRSGMQKILSYIKQNRFFFPLDTEIPCIEGLRIYNLRTDLVHGRDRKYSDTYYRL